MGGGGPGYSKRWGVGDLGIVRGGGVGGPGYSKRWVWGRGTLV